MKSLRKKVCISVFLNELFEAVDEDGKDYIRNKLDRIRKWDTRVVRSEVISEEILFQRVTRPRKYGNAWRISQRERLYFRKQLRELETEESRRRPAAEKVDRGTETNFSSVDENNCEYSLSDLTLERLAVLDGDKEPKTKRVDIALSTCFTEDLPNADESLTNMQSGEKLFGRSEKSHESTQTDGDNSDSERSYLKMQKIVEDVSRNNKCFLVSRCSKSTNLAAWNHKSTQLEVTSSSVPKQVNAAEDANGKGSELEEVFHCANSRKHSANTLRRASHVFTEQSQPIVPELMQHDVVGDFIQEDEKLPCTVKKTETKIIKKDFCDAAVKALVKARKERIICYAVSVPWEVSNLGEFIIPENNFRCQHSINESLTAFLTRRPKPTELGPFLKGTQCRNAIGDCWRHAGNGKSSDSFISQEFNPVIVELPEEEEPRKDETSDEQKVVESLASELTEEIKMFQMKNEERLLADKSVNTEPQTKAEEDDVSVQWELEIEIQKQRSSKVMSPASSENSATQMIKAIEGPSRTNVVLICQTPYENRLILEDSSTHSRLSGIEQCYLKDEKIRKMYLANVPRRLLHVTEKRLREISRS